MRRFRTDDQIFCLGAGMKMAKFSPSQFGEGFDEEKIRRFVKDGRRHIHQFYKWYRKLDRNSQEYARCQKIFIQSVMMLTALELERGEYLSTLENLRSSEPEDEQSKN